MSDNTVTLIGNITKDPELKFTPAGKAVTEFDIAVNRRYQQNGEWQEQTSFFTVVAWDELAENVGASLAKGHRVIVNGRLNQRCWETDEGAKRYRVELIADDIGPSLRWASAVIERTTRQTADSDQADG